MIFFILLIFLLDHPCSCLSHRLVTNLNFSGQKRLLDCITGSSAKKQKRSQKRSSTVCKTEKNGAGECFEVF